MKVLLIVLGVLLLLITVFLILPASVTISYYDKFEYSVKIGGYTLFATNKKKKPKKAKKSKKKKTDAKKETVQKEKPKPDISEIFNIVIDFLKNFKWKLNLKVKKLLVYISCASSDAAETAILFGKVNAYAYSADAILKSIVKVEESNINISVNYNDTKVRFAGELNIFSRIYNILLALIRLLVYLINNKEKLKPLTDYIINKDGVK